jgi:hypothetical protein
LIPKPLTNSLSTPREEEALLYLGVGAAVAFVLIAGVLVSILILVSKKNNVKEKEHLICNWTQNFHFLLSTFLQMIYPENFRQGIEREQVQGSYIDAYMQIRNI